MKGAFIILWFFLSILAGSVVFHTSEEVKNSRAETTRLETAIKEERESIRVLKAEWAYLNQPERLEKLAAEHLALAPAKGQQLADISRVPNREKQPDIALSQDAPPHKIVTSFSPKKTAEINPKPPAAPAISRTIPKKSEAPRDFNTLLQSLGGN